MHRASHSYFFVDMEALQFNWFINISKEKFFGVAQHNNQQLAKSKKFIADNSVYVVLTLHSHLLLHHSDSFAVLDRWNISLQDCYIVDYAEMKKSTYQ